MVGSNTVRIPKPLDWQAFERDCLVLFQCIWQDENAQRHGRTGQPQCGVDIYGQRNGAGPYIGVQCKLKEDGKEVADQELKDEIKKCKDFKPAISEFILVTTAPDDTKIQETVRLINEESKKEGINLKVAVWGWGKLETEIHKHEPALDAFDPESSPRIKKALVNIQGALGQIAQQQVDVTTMLTKSGVSQTLATALPDFLLQAAISTDLPLPPRYFTRPAVLRQDKQRLRLK